MKLKIEVTNDVAVSIESIRKQGVFDPQIVSMVLDLAPHSNIEKEIGVLRSKYDIENIGELASALVYGYDIIKTPEEKIKDYMERNYSLSGYEVGAYTEIELNGEAYAVAKFILNTLNVKVKGINL
ncbi:hypothetical protein P4571_08360 [Niallia alba]|uniref:hypothetical protein n=1 Tax=Niallia alba TaxID=2729105 RepID=UPI002E1CDBD1|nr:hypothetical protein [Niallia alba]